MISSTVIVVIRNLEHGRMDIATVGFTTGIMNRKPFGVSHGLDLADQLLRRRLRKGVAILWPPPPLPDGYRRPIQGTDVMRPQGRPNHKVPRACLSVNGCRQFKFWESCRIHILWICQSAAEHVMTLGV